MHAINAVCKHTAGPSFQAIQALLSPELECPLHSQGLLHSDRLPLIFHTII